MITIEKQPVNITLFPDGTSKFTCKAFAVMKQTQPLPKVTI